MFSDTHFHFLHTVEILGIQEGGRILSGMADRDCFFGLDIGTDAADLAGRQDCVLRAISEIGDEAAAEKCRRFIRFSAGIWPDLESIRNRLERMEVLSAQIGSAAENSGNGPLDRRIAAVGECGIDHHWNPSGADGRSGAGFSSDDFDGERELFMMQLELARRLELPVIVHSRDAFDDTLGCLRDSGWSRGVIHCFSYGISEARAFLDLGWYISLSGGITYTKRSRMDGMRELLEFIPDDRILCETDSPYLAPVPFRGKTDTPLLVDNTYRFAAEMRGTDEFSLSRTVDRNISSLFGMNPAQ